MKSSSLPDGIPVLSRGRHRTPRRGACFMEFASVLAGERWSDHPSCTHPLLAQLARHVNDHTTDAGRQELTLLIPSVVGRRGTIGRGSRSRLRSPLERSSTFPKGRSACCPVVCFKLNSCVPTPSPIWPQPGGPLNTRSSWFPAQSLGSSGLGCDTG